MRSTNLTSFGRWGLALVLVSALSAARLAAQEQASEGAARPARAIEIVALSTHADRVTGGDVLVRVTAPMTVREPVAHPMVTLEGRDVSAAFRPGDSAGSFL